MAERMLPVDVVHDSEIPICACCVMWLVNRDDSGCKGFCSQENAREDEHPAGLCGLLEGEWILGEEPTERWTETRCGACGGMFLNGAEMGTAVLIVENAGPKIVRVIGRIEMSDGSRSKFMLSEAGSMQWGADKKRLGETVDIVSDLMGAAREYIGWEDEGD